MVGRFHGMLYLSRNIQDLLSYGKTPYEKRLGEPFARPKNTVWCNGLISPYFGERHIETTSMLSKNLAKYLPWIRSVRGENLEG